MGKITFDPQSPVIEVDITLEGKGGIKRELKWPWIPGRPIH